MNNFYNIFLSFFIIISLQIFTFIIWKPVWRRAVEAEYMQNGPASAKFEVYKYSTFAYYIFVGPFFNLVIKDDDFLNTVWGSV